LLGYHHLGADLIWLQAIQVLGERVVRTQDYEWLSHALDVITTLDPKFVAVYDTGGVMLTELAGRVDWSNRLLAKGTEANPTVWRLPYLLGFNHFFYLHEYQEAAKYLTISAQLPGRPAYVPELAARLYVEAKNPELALAFLDRMLEQTADLHTVGALVRRRDEVAIERDLAALDRAVDQYVEHEGALPASLAQLVDRGIISFIPLEPFSGIYRLDETTGHVFSTTHPDRLRLHHPGEAEQVAASTEAP
jgi:hypothetical protein